MRHHTRSTATQRGLWQNAYREFLTRRTIAVAWITIALFVAAMTIFGPLGTAADLGPLRRLLYWGLSAVVTFPLCYATAAAVLYVMRFCSLVETVPAVAAAVLFEGVVCTATVHTADTLFRPHYTGASLEAIYVTVTAVVAVCTFFVHYVVFQRTRRAVPTPAGAEDRSPSADSGSPVTPVPSARRTGGERGDGPEAAVSRPTARQAAFYDRLPQDVSRDIIYLTVDDHYVEIHTHGGSCIVLMNFGTAVADLGALGIQVHRSYWVARRHLIATVRRDGRTLARVTGGHLVPVSRTYLPAVREALRSGARNAAARTATGRRPS